MALMSPMIQALRPISFVWTSLFPYSFLDIPDDFSTPSRDTPHSHHGPKVLKDCFNPAKVPLSVPIPLFPHLLAQFDISPSSRTFCKFHNISYSPLTGVDG